MIRGWSLEEKDGLGIVRFDALGKYAVSYGFSQRFGGISGGKCSSLNLSTKRKDNIDNVRENFRRFCKAMGVDENGVVMNNYDHGDNTEAVDEGHAGNGYFRENRLPVCDGIITKTKGIALTTLHADCTPVVLYDTKLHVSCLVHSGWKGTLKHASLKALQKMGECFGSQPEDCIAGLGPSIGICCFEVDEPVKLLFDKKFSGLTDYIEKRGIKYHIDIAKCNAYMLHRAGVKQDNIYVSSLCTYCEEDSFFSFRRDGEGTGAMAQMMVLH